MRNVATVDARPLILSLEMDADTFGRLDALRRRHFPPERNVLAAHVTLFHALPGTELAEIASDLRAVTAATPAFDLKLQSVRFLGKGVAVDVTSDALRQVRAVLLGRWLDWLGPQDRQPYRPHVTVQNKVDAPTARALYERLRATWQPTSGQGTGLQLWRYLGGPWEAVDTFRFAAPT